MKGGMKRSDTGVVSLMVTIIMMLVISLIVLGFAQISRREERQSLDRQLSTQAFLAAESGVNDARSAMQTYIKAGHDTIPDKTSCDNSSNGAGSPFNSLNYTNGLGYAINKNNNVAYTCLLVTTKLKNIHQTVTYDGPSSVIPIHPQGGGQLTTLHFTWSVADQTVTPNPSRCSSSAPALLPSNDASTGYLYSCDYGVLRVDMVPTDSLNRQNLHDSQRTFFLYPTSRNAPAVNYGDPSSSGRVLPMECDFTNCKVDIGNIAGSNTYALRLTSVYKDGIVDITADGTSGPMQLADAQAQVDSTGKAQDVLRRIQVRLSLILSNESPNFGLQSGGSICKRFTVMPDSGQFAQGSPIMVNDPSNPMCQSSFISPPDAVGCTLRGPNLLTNGDFALGAGTNVRVQQAVQPQYGFSSKIPNRGPDVFPDDPGENGINPGWLGGFSIWSHPGDVNPPYSTISPFNGDPALGVLPATHYFYSNPYRSVDDPQTPSADGSTFTGILWESTVTGLQPNKTYDFSGYFSNALTDYFYQHAKEKGESTINPTIALRVDGTTVWTQRVIEPNSGWNHIFLRLRTAPGQREATFTIDDSAGYVNGDDFAMTQLSVRQCRN